jgi:hypothetical protein
MSDPIRSISQNNFILADQKEVSHDNTLTGKGTPESPLGVNDFKWQDVTTEFNPRNISSDSSMTFMYNATIGLIQFTFKFKANNGSYGDSQYAVCDIPTKYTPSSVFELSTWNGTNLNYCDLISNKLIPRNANGYFSGAMCWVVSSAVQANS